MLSIRAAREGNGMLLLFVEETGGNYATEQEMKEVRRSREIWAEIDLSPLQEGNF